MCEAMKGIRSDAEERGEENYKRKQRALHDKMKEDGREAEFIETLDDDAKMTSLFEEYGIS